MKKILMLVSLLVILAGCSGNDENMSSPPASTNAAATNAPAK
jgi:PBP1b-binding outer membrane lipoprotein LpoB